MGKLAGKTSFISHHSALRTLAARLTPSRKIIKRAFSGEHDGPRRKPRETLEIPTLEIFQINSPVRSPCKKYTAHKIYACTQSFQSAPIFLFLNMHR